MTQIHDDASDEWPPHDEVAERLEPFIGDESWVSLRLFAAGLSPPS